MPDIKQPLAGAFPANEVFRDIGGGNFAKVVAFAAADPVQLTGDVVVDTLGALGDAAVTDPAAGSATIPALLRGLISALAGHAGTDGSTTITAGGTAQNLFGGSTPARGFEVSNPNASE